MGFAQSLVVSDFEGPILLISLSQRGAGPIRDSRDGRVNLLRKDTLQFRQIALRAMLRPRIAYIIKKIGLPYTRAHTGVPDASHPPVLLLQGRVVV